MLKYLKIHIRLRIVPASLLYALATGHTAWRPLTPLSGGTHRIRVLTRVLYTYSYTLGICIVHNIENGTWPEKGDLNHAWFF